VNVEGRTDSGGGGGVDRHVQAPTRDGVPGKDKATPLTVMVFTSTGALPVSVKVFAVVPGPLALNSGVFRGSCAGCSWGAGDVASQAEGVLGLMPLARNAAYLRPQSGSHWSRGIGPVQSSLRARQ